MLWGGVGGGALGDCGALASAGGDPVTGFTGGRGKILRGGEGGVGGTFGPKFGASSEAGGGGLKVARLTRLHQEQTPPARTG